jgi:hypothetical protein
MLSHSHRRVHRLIFFYKVHQEQACRNTPSFGGCRNYTFSRREKFQVAYALLKVEIEKKEQKASNADLPIVLAEAKRIVRNINIMNQWLSTKLEKDVQESG